MGRTKWKGKQASVRGGLWKVAMKLHVPEEEGDWETGLEVTVTPAGVRAQAGTATLPSGYFKCFHCSSEVL